MNIRDQILEDFGEEAETMLFADGFDDAILGLGIHLVASCARFTTLTWC